MSIKQGATPELQLDVQGKTFTDENISICLDQQDVHLRLKGDRVTHEKTKTGSMVYVTLTQKESAKLRPGHVDIRVNWIDKNGNVDYTEPVEMSVDPEPYRGDLSYE